MRGNEGDTDEDLTVQDLPAVTPSYDRAPPTIEEQISPFHPAAKGRTAPGMAPVPNPEIRTKSPTAPGMAGLPVPAPRIVHADELTPPDGPTRPDGHFSPFGMDAPTDPVGVEIRGDLIESSGNWDAPTDPEAPRAPRPEVPRPGDPNILISKSLEMQVAQLEEDAVTDPRQAPLVPQAARRPPPGPTEVALPAMKKHAAREKEGSDWLLIAGLAGLAFVILALVAAVVVGVLASM